MRSSRTPASLKPLSQKVSSYILYVFCGFVFLLLVAPTFVVVPISFSSSRFLQFPPPGFSTQWYENYFTSRDWMEATWTSLQIASAVCILATVLGTILAVALVKGRFPGKNMIYALAVSPMIIPLIISAVAIYFFYSRLHMVGTKAGVVIAHTILAIPFVLVIVSSALKGFDETLERASLSLGANPLKTFLLVTLPVIRPAVISGALFAFITSFDEVVIVIFIAGTHAVTLPKRMWDGIRLEIDPTIAAVASLLIGLSVLLMIAISLHRKRR
ncbi:MAG: ABC transporter permease [Deltaproteobacteria bacterium]|nr:ABC transporter permease [Deltaproteobacteria bacterium]MBW2121444.1 ABC transporter permease [Deltaproteobacteria bacterium]